MAAAGGATGKRSYAEECAFIERVNGHSYRHVGDAHACWHRRGASAGRGSQARRVFGRRAPLSPAPHPTTQHQDRLRAKHACAVHVLRERPPASADVRRARSAGAATCLVHASRRLSRPAIRAARRRGRLPAGCKAAGERGRAAGHCEGFHRAAGRPLWLRLRHRQRGRVRYGGPGGNCVARRAPFLHCIPF